MEVLEQFLETESIAPEEIRKIKACYGSLDKGAPDDYRQTAAYLVWEWCACGFQRIGLGGGQGAGKSTLSRLFVEAGGFYKESVIALSIDDFYHTKSERRRLAASVHSLLETRGPPGTHELDSLIDSIDLLLGSGDVLVPVFDKGLDERIGERLISGTAKRVIVEGWCVGASAVPKSDLKLPINALELNYDKSGVWRSYVNDALESEYLKLNSLFDQTIFLQVPNMETVKRWRLDQERERPIGQRMTKNEVGAFVDHYERVTLAMLRVLPRTANIVIELDFNHRVASIKRN